MWLHLHSWKCRSQDEKTRKGFDRDTRIGNTMNSAVKAEKLLENSANLAVNRSIKIKIKTKQSLKTVAPLDQYVDSKPQQFWGKKVEPKTMVDDL